MLCTSPAPRVALLLHYRQVWLTLGNFSSNLPKQTWKTCFPIWSFPQPMVSATPPFHLAFYLPCSLVPLSPPPRPPTIALASFSRSVGRNLGCSIPYQSCISLPQEKLLFLYNVVCPPLPPPFCLPLPTLPPVIDHKCGDPPCASHVPPWGIVCQQ